MWVQIRRQVHVSWSTRANDHGSQRAPCGRTVGQSPLGKKKCCPAQPLVPVSPLAVPTPSVRGTGDPLPQESRTFLPATHFSTSCCKTLWDLKGQRLQTLFSPIDIPTPYWPHKWHYTFKKKCRMRPPDWLMLILLSFIWNCKHFVSSTCSDDLRSSVQEKAFHSGVIHRSQLSDLCTRGSVLWPKNVSRGC